MSSNPPRVRRRPPPPPKSHWRRLLAYAVVYRRQMAGATITLLLSTALGLLGPIQMQHLVDAIVPGGDSSQLTSSMLLLVAIFIAQGLAMLVRGYLFEMVGLRIIADLRRDLFAHLTCLSPSFYSARRTGELVSRVVNDSASLGSTLTEELASGIAYLLTFVGAMVWILYTNWRLTLFMIAIVPVVSLIASRLGRRVRTLSVSVQDAVGGLAAGLEETISGMRIVQSFVGERFERERFEKVIRKTFSAALARVKVQVLSGPIVSILFLVAVVFVVWFGGREVVAGRMTTGELVTFILLTMNMGNAIRQLGRLWNTIQQALGSSERLFELLDCRPEIEDAEWARNLPTVAGRIRFSATTFSYPRAGDNEQPALADLNLEIEAGEMLALVGPSGAGKTTLVNLIPRFFDPTAGRILIDDLDISDVTLASLRSQVGMVPQETYLFAGTVRENLQYGRPRCTVKEMTEAAHAANAHEFIERLPNGYDTIVGERGLRLSGGQRQRLAIARAILKNPRILLLDEATSALDNESEELVQEALDRLMSGRTTIVIAHRLSTIKKADRVAVLDQGRLVELGTSTDLLARGGLYARLHRLQFKSEGEG